MLAALAPAHPRRRLVRRRHPLAAPRPSAWPSPSPASSWPAASSGSSPTPSTSRSRTCAGATGRWSRSGHTLILGGPPRCPGSSASLRDRQRERAVGLRRGAGPGRQGGRWEEAVPRAGRRHWKSTRVVCRSGSPASPDDLRRVGVTETRSVGRRVSDADGDAGVVKAVLGVRADRPDPRAAPTSSPSSPRPTTPAPSRPSPTAPCSPCRATTWWPRSPPRPASAAASPPCSPTSSTSTADELYFTPAGPSSAATTSPTRSWRSRPRRSSAGSPPDGIGGAQPRRRGRAGPRRPAHRGRRGRLRRRVHRHPSRRRRSPPVAATVARRRAGPHAWSSGGAASAPRCSGSSTSSCPPAPRGGAARPRPGSTPAPSAASTMEHASLDGPPRRRRPRRPPRPRRAPAARPGHRARLPRRPVGRRRRRPHPPHAAGPAGDMAGRPRSSTCGSSPSSSTSGTWCWPTRWAPTTCIVSDALASLLMARAA